MSTSFDVNALIAELSDFPLDGLDIEIKEVVYQGFDPQVQKTYETMIAEESQVGKNPTKPTIKHKTRTHTKQPKKPKFYATEIQFKDTAKGGLAFELILADPVTQTPPKRPSSPNGKNISALGIEEKLKAAEDRRKSRTENQLAALQAKMAKVEEARKKNDEQEKLFIQQTEKTLKQKVAAYEENRESHINYLKTKLKEHLEVVEKSRANLEQQTADVAAAIQEKLKTAANQRDENLKKMVEKLKEHREHLKRVRESNQSKIDQWKNQIDSKLVSAEERRNSIEGAIKQKLKEHEQRVEKVRQKNKEKCAFNSSPEEEIPSSG